MNKTNFFIIANPSSLHLITIKKIIKFNKPIFVEKPFVTQRKFSSTIKNFKKMFVLYQMRFDPRIKFIKKKIANKKIIKGNFIWKTYLPTWHSYENYKKSYASKKNLGGGVIFTMSHEIDMAIFLLGKVKKVFVKKIRNKLKIDVEDNVKIKLYHEKNYSTNLQLSFASKKNERNFNIELDNDNYYWNFFENKVQTKYKDYNFRLNNDGIYKKQMKKLLSNLNKKNYTESEINLKKILHTQNVINACIESLNKRKIVSIN